MQPCLHIAMTMTLCGTCLSKPSTAQLQIKDSGYALLLPGKLWPLVCKGLTDIRNKVQDVNDVAHQRLPEGQPCNDRAAHHAMHRLDNPCSGNLHPLFQCLLF